MLFSSEYSRIKLNLLKAVFSYVMPFTSYEKYQNLLNDYKLTFSPAANKLPAVIQGLISDYCGPIDAQIQTEYDQHMQGFINYASPIYDYSIPVIASALLKYGYDHMLDNRNVEEIMPDNMDVEEIIRTFDMESIGLLFKSVSNFGRFDPNDIKTIVKKLGLESLKTIVEIGAKLDDMNPQDVSQVIEMFGIEAIELLSKAGVKFDDLPQSIVIDITRSLGVQSIKLLSEAGVKLGDYVLAQPDQMDEVILSEEHSHELAPYYSLETQLA